MKKLLAILAATAVLASATLVTTSTLAMTADADCTVIITNDVDGSSVKQSYDFYQIFGGTVSSSAFGNESIGEMQDIVWGLAISDGDGFILDLQTAFSGQFDGCTTAAAVAAVIKTNFTTTQDIDKLAAEIADYIDTSGAAATATTTGNEAAIDSSGYYLIVDKSMSSNSGLGDSEEDEYDISKHMLAVINAEEETMTITTKNEKPSLVKKVCENNANNDLSWDNDAGYNDIADYCIGDEVPFNLYATLPSTFDGFDTYYLCFHDQLGKQFAFNDTSVTVTLRVDKNDYPIDSNDYEVVTTILDGCTFEVAFDDILDIDLSNLTSSIYTSWEEVAGAEIIVSYNATLTADAEIGFNGQENQACLEYSNNANNEATGDGENTGFTPWDKVIVFTYELDIDKVSSADGSLLAGAEFTLQNSNNEYAVLDGDAESGYIVTGWNSSSEMTIKTIAGKTVTIKGLDDGEYTLTETTAPSGYKQAGPWKLTIASDHDDNISGNQDGQQDWNDGIVSDALLSLTLTGDDSNNTVSGNIIDGTVKATIKNTSGAELPTTGGIGTTIFYVAGGVLVVGAGVLLISRKRSRS